MKEGKGMIRMQSEMKWFFFLISIQSASLAFAEANLEPSDHDRTGISAEQTILIFGDAYESKTHQLLYHEEHVIHGQEHYVTYKKDDGSTFAEKKLSYHLSYVTPVYNLEDKRFKRNTGSEFRDNEWYLYRREESGHSEELKLEQNEGLVIDAGFNNFVRINFDTLASGVALKFQFGLTDPLIQLPMKLQGIPCSKRDAHYDDALFLCLRARNTSLLYRWFVPDIYVIYSRDQHFLMQYDGPSNLLGDNDKGQSVHIDYRYEVTAAE